MQHAIGFNKKIQYNLFEEFAQNLSLIASKATGYFSSPPTWTPRWRHIKALTWDKALLTRFLHFITSCRFFGDGWPRGQAFPFPRFSGTGQGHIIATLCCLIDMQTFLDVCDNIGKGLGENVCFIARSRWIVMGPCTKQGDLFIVCYRSVCKSVADLQTIYRWSTDYLQIICRMSAERLHGWSGTSLQICRRSADEISLSC